ncbi:hypothetical protein L4D15_15055 [Enterovibrio norvegicus]|uniref:hypothetical protein n=1 Tax=Enterovibrio norvegicus TaxID=188144 RepID=UPI00030FA5D9|nr:hypothetical protein [Enterovibrio norvegicus]OEE63623.1 hypothetical protein A1OS_17020 [Enterovibrio norvegicus]
MNYLNVESESCSLIAYKFENRVFLTLFYALLCGDVLYMSCSVVGRVSVLLMATSVDGVFG